MSDATDTTVTPDPVERGARTGILAHTLFRLGQAAGASHNAGEALGHAKRRLAARGLGERELKAIDDADQVVAHAGEQLARAAAILTRLAHGTTGPAVVPHEQAEPGGYYDFAGYAPPPGGGGG